MKTENFREEFREIEGIKVRVTEYKIGEEYYCHIYNADPGATIARASAFTRDAAEKEAMRKAVERISATLKKS
jgi:hypothetical protein